MIGLGLGITSRLRGDFAVSPITAVITPSLSALIDGDTIASAVSADYDQITNYASSEGTISSVVAEVTVNGVSALFTDTVDFEDSVVLTVTVTDSEGNVRVFTALRVVGAFAPDPFDVADWGLANDNGDISVNILTLPSDGGAPITDLEYRVNAGAAVSFGETTTGSYPIVAVEGDDVQIRAVNAVGAGDWSDVKVVPSAIPANAIHDRAGDPILDRAGNFILTRA
jgi:hypothetical protein